MSADVFCCHDLRVLLASIRERPGVLLPGDCRVPHLQSIICPKKDINSVEVKKLTYGNGLM